MQLPPVHSISATEYFASGNVDIHATAVIAPGAILDAAEDCRIVIGAGVCLGLGTILIAQAGDIVIEDGAALGPGTLVIGPATIAHDTCIGSRSTIFQQDIEAQSLIPAGHLLMEEIPADHRPSAPSPVPPTAAHIPPPISPIPSPWDNPDAAAIAPPSPEPESKTQQPEPPQSPPPSPQPDQVDKVNQVNQVEQLEQPEEIAPPPPPAIPEVILTRPEDTEISQKPGEKVPVVGQVYINQLLLTLFPERKYFQS